MSLTPVPLQRYSCQLERLTVKIHDRYKGGTHYVDQADVFTSANTPVLLFEQVPDARSWVYTRGI